MKALLVLLLTISIIPVSILGMIYGWGLTPASVGWITASYVWIFLCPMFVQAITTE